MGKSPLFNHGQLTVSPYKSDFNLSDVAVTCGFEDVLPVEDKATVRRHLDGSIKTFRFGQRSRLHYYSKVRSELNGSDDDAVLQYHDATVYRSDLKNLNTDEWLNDNNICFLYEYLEKRCFEKNPAKREKIVLLRPSMAYLLLHTDDPKSLIDVLPQLDKARFIFVPINDNPDVTQIEGGCHWSLLVICIADNRALYYDTMENGNYEVSKETASKFSKMLGRKLNFIIAPTPQQANMSDCGVLVCEITALLLKRLLEADESNTVDLSLQGLAFSASAGRTFMLTAIMEQIAAQK